MTDRERFERAAEIFLRAVSLPPADLAAYLDAQCAGDDQLRREVQSLVDAARDGTAFQTLADAFASMHAHVRREAATPAFTDGPTEHPGQLIGRYKLIAMIGEGGFGRVWTAQQLEPVTRTVALKVIKAGMDTRQVVARFEQERQALALMDHPGIAKVFDAGATDTGRPYFVMELCDGQPISTFCDAHNLSISDRLNVARQVCAAVQHAHTKGVIHRDLKPSNVLVSLKDGAPLAKVIDFGIAKATARITDTTVYTEHRQLIGTPQYMSPEQAEGSLDIDTRTDIYSLGVILYELLTGTTPFQAQDLHRAAQAEIHRIISEVDPPKPSTRLLQSGEALATVAARRNTEATRITGLIRGELDWIVMKALDKDRTRRYDSAGALAEDLRRFLTGEEVAAAPPSRAYTLRKFARRHRGPVAAGATIAILLLAGITAFAWQARVATDQRDRAVTAEEQANTRAAELKRVADFQSRMLAQVDAASAGLNLATDVRNRFAKSLDIPTLSDNDRTLRTNAFTAEWSRVNTTDVALEVINATILKPALATIGEQFADSPRLEAKLRSAISERYLELGLYDDAWAVSERVVAMLKASAGEDDPETIAALIVHHKLLMLRGKSADAITQLRALIDRHAAHLGRDNGLILRALDVLGEALIQDGKPADAEPLFAEVLERRRRTLGEDHTETLTSTANLARISTILGKLDIAEPLERDTLDRRRRVLGENHPDTLVSHDNYGDLLLNRDKPADAAREFRAAMEGRKRLLGEVHPRTLLSAGNLSVALSRMGKPDEAEAMQRDNLALTRKILGPDHPDTLNALSNFVSYLLGTRKLAEAEPLCVELIQRRERISGPNHPNSLIAYNIASILYRELKRPADAETYLKNAVDASRTVLGEDHPDRIVYLINFGSLERDLGKPDDAAKALADALERSARTLGPTHLYARFARLKLAEVLDDQHNAAEVIALLGPAEKDYRAAEVPPGDDTLGLILLFLGIAHARQDNFAVGERYLLEAHGLLHAINPAGSTTRNTTLRLIDLYTIWAKTDPAAEPKLADWKQRLDAFPTAKPKP